MDDENRIVQSVLKGDLDNFAVLVDRYKQGLYFHCFSIVRDENTAEDLAQESFIQAYRHLKKYNPDYKFSTWLYKIATNKSIDHLRRYQPSLLDQPDLDRLHSNLPSPRTQAENSELRAKVDKLPVKYRSVLSLYYWQGQNYQEISEIMDAPIGSIKAWMSRAKNMLKEELI